jgi:hypothetical protein
MSTTNNGRPMPWHDTPTCDAPDAEYAGIAAERGVCGGPMVPVDYMPNGYNGPKGSRIACTACGTARVGTPEDVARAKRAQAAWDALLSGTIHEDRGCVSCNAPLPLERERLCERCVDKDIARRQAPLFPEIV